MGKTIESDKMQWELLIKDSEAQREIAKLTQNNKELEKSNKEVRLEMAKLEAQGKKSSEEWNGLRAVLQKNNTEISNNTKLIKANEDSLGAQNMTMSQLRKKYKELRQELDHTNKALDPKAWNDIKAKMDEVKGAQDELTGKTKQSEGVLLSWGSAMKVGAVGALVAVGGKLLSVAKDWFSLDKIIKSTQETGDKFEKVMAGVGNTLDYVRASLATMDFTNFTKNLKEAYNVAAEAAEKLDELFEMNNSFRIENTQVAAAIEDQYEIMNNVNLSYKTRQIAAEKIKSMTLEQATLEKEIASQAADAYRDLLSNRTKLSDKDLEFVVDHYNQNKKIIKQAKELIDLENKLKEAKKSSSAISAPSSFGVNTQRVGSAQTKDNDRVKRAKDDLAAFKKIYSQQIAGIENVARMVKSYDRSNDESVTKYVESRVKMMNVDVEAQRSLRRVEKNINTMNKNIADEVSARQKEVAQMSEKQKEESYKKEIEAAEKASKEKLITIKKQYVDGLIDQKEYAAQSEVVEDDLIKEKIKINGIFAKDITDLTDKLISNQIARLEKLKKETEKLKGGSNANNGMSGVVSDAVLSSAANAVDLYTARLERATAAADGLKDKRKEALKDLEVSYKTELTSLNDALSLKMISQEQYQEGVSKLDKETWQKRFEINSEGAKNTIETVQQALSSAAEITQGLQNMEITQLEAKKQKELKLHGKTAEDRQAIEEKYEKEKLKVQQKYADMDMGIKIAQTLAAGALAIIQAFAQLGPVGGAIAAVVVAATTAIQVATIVAQRNAIKNSSGSGTSSSGTSPRRTVISASSGSSASDYSETAEVTRVPSAKTPTAMTGIHNIGTLTRQNTAKETAESTAVMEANTKAMSDVSKAIGDLKKNPIKSYVVYNELEASRETAERIKSNGSL